MWPISIPPTTWGCFAKPVTARSEQSHNKLSDEQLRVRHVRATEATLGMIARKDSDGLAPGDHQGNGRQVALNTDLFDAGLSPRTMRLTASLSAETIFASLAPRQGRDSWTMLVIQYLAMVRWDGETRRQVDTERFEAIQGMLALLFEIVEEASAHLASYRARLFQQRDVEHDVSC
jgi:hypothetical protein